MCIVLDINVFTPVFDASSKNHKDFAPISDWLRDGKGFLVYGGSRYKQELRAAGNYLKLFLELKRSGNAIEICQNIVDAEEKYVTQLCSHRDFDDQHIVAIFRSSGCKLLCSLDERAYRFIRDRRFYHKGQRPPSIYKTRAHAKLLKDWNIVKIRNCA